MRVHLRVCSLAVLLGSGAQAQLYTVHFSCPAVITLPVAEPDAAQVYVRAPGGRWEPAEYELRGASVRIALDPGKLGGGRASVLINPPAGVDIQDLRPPRLTSIVLDGRKLPTELPIALRPAATWPKRLSLVAQDGENEMDAQAVRVFYDGEELSQGVSVTESAPRSLRVQVSLPEPRCGQHVIGLSLQDVSPQANRLEGEIRFARYDMTNRVLKAHGTRMVADSYFVNYPSLDCLQDGDVNLPGHTLPNEVSWASLEHDGPHWVEVTFAAPRTIRQVTVYWANYTDELHTSRHFEVQLPEGDGWRTVYRSPEEGEAQARYTVVSFPAKRVTGFRVWQPGGGGSPSRPNLMWLAEIEAR